MTMAISLAALEADIANMEAVRAAKRLQHSWGHYAEAGDFAAMADLFARDGLLVLPPEEARGRAAILDLLRRTMADGAASLGPDQLNLRLILSPVVTVDQSHLRAKGRWHEVAMTGTYGSSASWSGGIHENNYVLEDSVWKIAAIRFHPQFAGLYSPGWRHAAPDVPLVPYHYTPRQAGTPVPLDPVARQGADADARSLAARSAALVDEGAIHNLQSAYGYYLDRKLWDDVTDLFTADGVREIGGEGAFVGRERIRRSFDRFGPVGLQRGELNNHLQLMPVVTIAPDGESATLRGIELQMLGLHGAGSHWGLRICETSFVKNESRWMIKSMRVSPRMFADYDIGWGQYLPPIPGPSSELPPDRAVPLATAYPDHRGPAIGFAHPVVGPRPAPPVRPDGEMPGADAIVASLAVAKAFDGAENVANAYGYYIDEFRWDDTADLFSVEGWKELSYIGTYIGRERVRESLFSRYGNRGRNAAFLAIHQKTQPYVTVLPDARSAQIRLRLFQFNSSREGDGSYIDGIYEDQVVLEDGVWKIHGMDLDYVFLANYTGGWAKLDPTASARYAPKPEDVAKFPPDGPLRGVRFAPYPEIGPIGFHYVNPVSGRKPPIFLPWSDGQFA